MRSHRVVGDDGRRPAGTCVSSDAVTPRDPTDQAGRLRALGRVAASLRCPVCAQTLALDDTSPFGARLLCGAGHTFDVARQGYVNLVGGRTHAGTADTADMVAARDTFLRAGHLAPVRDALAALAVRHAPASSGVVVDVAGGTGHYLAGVLDALQQRDGVCLDLSPAALRRAARAHPRAAAVGADVWQGLPIGDSRAALLLNVFGPRNAAEFARVLRPDGVLLSVSPEPDHLGELVEPLGMVGVDPRKEQRLDEAFSAFAPIGHDTVRYQVSLGHEDVAAVVGMGPTASHTTSTVLAERIATLPERQPVTVAVRIMVYGAGEQRRTTQPAVGSARDIQRRR